MFWKKISSEEYLELKKEIEALKISFKTLQLDLELVIKKLKFKYKISTRENPEANENPKDLSKEILLPE